MEGSNPGIVKLLQVELSSSSQLAMVLHSSLMLVEPGTAAAETGTCPHCDSGQSRVDQVDIRGRVEGDLKARPSSICYRSSDGEMARGK